MKFSKFAVLFVLISAVTFTAVTLVMTAHGHSVPDSLIGAVFAFLAGEAGFLGIIKCSNNKHNGGKNDDAIG